MAAAEAHDLHELHVGALRGKHAGGKHARVEVVHHVDQAVVERYLFAAGHRVGGYHGDAALGEQRGQVVVHQGVVMVRAAGQHHGVGAVAACLRQHFGTAFLQRAVECLLRRARLLQRLRGGLLGNLERVLEVLLQLKRAVFLGEPVEQRVVEGDVPAALGVVGVLHHQRVALHHGAHGLAVLRRVFRGHGGDDGHEDAVDALFVQVAQVAVHQLGGEAHGVGRHGGKAVLVYGARAGVRELHGEAQRLQQRFPEGHGVPVGKHARHADDRVLAGRHGGAGPVLEQQLLALVVEVGHAVHGLLGGKHLLAHGGVLGVAHHFAAGAAVAGYPRGAVGERDARAVAAVGAERADQVGFLLVAEALDGLPADEAAGGAGAVRAARLLLLGVLLRDERDADGAHQPGVGRAGHGAPHVLLEGAQHRVVQEGAALHHDVVAQLVQVGNADHLGEDVLDDASAQARHDVVGGLAVLLLGDDAAVHEHGAAAAQVGGGF